jgi:cytoskeleton protein RodZ
MSTEESTSAQHVVLIGECLRLRREETRMSLEKVSQKTKISLNILRALEANDFEALPSPAYVKGFVLSYARVVGLSPTDIITKLEYTYLTVTGRPFPALNHTKNMLGTSTPSEKSPSPPAEASSATPSAVLADEQASRERRRVIVPSLVFVGVALVFIGLYQLVTRTIDNETSAKVQKPSGPTFVPSSELIEMNKPVVATETKAEEKPAAPVEEAPKKEEKPAEVKEVRRNFPPKDFRKVTVKLFSVIPDAPEAQDPAILPENFKAAVDRNLENIYVRAVDGNTWLSYKVDNQPIVSIVLEKGKDVFMQGKEVLIFLGNVKVTRIFYQNRLIDPPTKTGFKSLIFPESSNSKHVLPLFPKASDDILYTAEEYQRRMKIEEEELGGGTPR